MTHDTLVERAGRWLYGRHKCVAVFTEASCYAFSEQPDAIGWTSRGHSILIEAKVSRSDFLHDAHKPVRRLEAATTGRPVGVGAERWYLTPPDLIPSDDVPEGWGLAYAYERRVKVVVKPTTREPDRLAELALQVAELRRIREGWRRLGKDGCGLMVENQAGATREEK